MIYLLYLNYSILILIQINLCTLFSQNCKEYAAGKCNTLVDGYFVEVCICTGLGIMWYIFLNRILKNLQSKEPNEWQVHNDRPINKLENTIGSLPDLIVNKSSKH